jgi:hypothetical protein
MRLIVATLLLSASCFAASITETATLPLTPTDFSDLPLAIAQFNPALGTLDSLTITVTGTTTGTATITNNSSITGTYTDAIFTMLTVDDPTKTPILGASPAFPVNVTIASGSTVTTPTSTGSATNTITTNTGLSTYLGTGSVDFFVSGSGAATITGPTPFSISQITDAGATLSVTYNYAAVVPEPSTLALCGLSLIGIGCYMRRPKRSASNS